jgi:CDP-6-deoxy-D-xylo-4-hexulose-3-dehydrase
MIERRREICEKFKSILMNYGNRFHIPNFNGNSSFCLPFILNDKVMKKDLQEYLEDNGIETRPLCSGNLLRQPFLKDYSLGIDNPKVDYLHFNGFFIGNNHLITNNDIEKLEELLYEYFAIL